MKPVTGYPGYLVNESGQVFSTKRGSLIKLKQQPHRQGYLFVSLYGPKGKWVTLGHIVVAKEFLPPPPTPNHEINHKDGNKANNHKDNLEWMTRAENVKHSYRVLGNTHKTWTMTDPEGNVHSTTNLAKFCSERGLNEFAMSKMLRGVGYSHHKNWTP